MKNMDFSFTDQLNSYYSSLETIQDGFQHPARVSQPKVSYPHNTSVS